MLQDPRVSELLERHGRELVIRHVRQLLDEARQQAAAGDVAQLEETLKQPASRLTERLAEVVSASLNPLINATGVVIHTNLGRAPVSPEVARRVALVATSYSNLELDLATGERGNRELHAETRLRELVAAEATAVVNNNAAAVLLAVNTLAEGREVLVSRGELVEIGGSFRVPEILRKGGARLREVGTTNRTRLADYRQALGPETALILRVHRSNFRIDGFTETPGLLELAELSRELGVPLVEDLGSGLLAPSPGALRGEPTVAEALEAGVEAVTWSGDKLLGGPQAGMVAGRRQTVQAMRRNPLYRALRVDKMTLAALDAVLVEYQRDRARETVPVQRMLALEPAALRARAEAMLAALAAECPRLELALDAGSSVVGGGAAPGLPLPTTLITISDPSKSAARFAAALRAGQPPVVTRIAEDRVLVDLRTVLPEDEPTLQRAIAAVAKG